MTTMIMIVFIQAACSCPGSVSVYGQPCQVPNLSWTVAAAAVPPLLPVGLLDQLELT